MVVIKKLGTLVAVLLAFGLSGCMSNSLGPKSKAVDIMPGYTDVGVRSEGGFEAVFVDGKLVPMPLITNVKAGLIYDNSAVIEWETDVESDGYVEYGLTEIYGVSSHFGEEMQRRHRVQLDSLEAGMEYNFRVVASRHGLESARVYSKNYSFKTTLKTDAE